MRDAVSLAAPEPIVDGVRGVATPVWFQRGADVMTVGTERLLEVSLDLDVAVEGRAPYRVKAFRTMFPEIRLGMLRPGERIAVDVDRSDPERLAFDWSAP